MASKWSTWSPKIGKRLQPMKLVTEDIQGYTYGLAEVVASPVSLRELEDLKVSVGFTEEDRRYLPLAGKRLPTRPAQIVAHWRSGIIASIPNLARHSRTPEGRPYPEYLERSNLRFQQWILDTCLRPYDQDWLNYQHEIASRHTSTEEEQSRRSPIDAICAAARPRRIYRGHKRDHQAIPRRQGPFARRGREDARRMV